jgi:LysM repeat protein
MQSGAGSTESALIALVTFFALILKHFQARDKEDDMRARRQLFIWTLVILALGLVLFEKLRDNASIANRQVNDAQSNPREMDLASFLSDSEEPRLENQIIETTTSSFENRPNPSRLRPNSPSAPMHLYHVRENDTLWQIARTHYVDLYTLVSVNKPENPDLIYPGQAIQIPPQRGVMHTIGTNETLEDIALQYDVTTQSIVDANAITKTDVIQAGWELFIPGAQLSKKLRTKLWSP